MGLIKQITAPVRSLVRFPLFQLAIVVALILFLQAADPASVSGRVFTGLDRLVGATVDGFAAVFDVRSFIKSWLTSGFWIGYVYLACLLILLLARLAIAGSSISSGSTTRSGCARQSRASAASRPTAPGCRSRKSGRRTFRSRNGRRPSPGRPAASRPTRRWRSGC